MDSNPIYGVTDYFHRSLTIFKAKNQYLPIQMRGSEKKYSSKSKFYLNKWFLDFVGDDGETMIFYAAELIWHGIRIPYANWLHCDSNGNITQKSRFRHVQFPEIENKLIHWNDSLFGIKGTWKKLTEAIKLRVFESMEGTLDWHCFQPASITKLNINGISLKGKGYVEKLILTVPVWKVPMDELRWGHVVSKNHQIVWIEIKNTESRKWLWLNAELHENCIIQDDFLLIPDINISLQLDKSTVLESEKKLTSITDKLVKFIPGIKKMVPVNFLLADECKWLSKVNIYRNNELCDFGYSIHEYVNFKPTEL